MRSTTFSLHTEDPTTPRGRTYVLALNSCEQDDLQCKPLLCAFLRWPGTSQRLFTIWPTGIQVGRHVFRTGFTCVGSNAVDDKLSSNWHPGPREAAIGHFHGLFGPKWPVRLDGVLGYFIVMPNGVPGTGLGAEMADVVVFKRGRVPGPTDCPDCGEVIRTWADHKGCALIGKLLRDLGIQVSPDAPSGNPIPPEQWGMRYGMTYEQAMALAATEPDTTARLKADMLAASTVTEQMVSTWRERAQRLGLKWRDWLAEVCGGKCTVAELTAREAEHALDALVTLQGKYTRAALDAMGNGELMGLYGEEFPGLETSGRAFSTERLLAVLKPVDRATSGVQQKH